MKRLFGVFSIIFVFSTTFPASGYEFKGSDYVLILVKGVCNASSMWGVSGSASMYVYSPNGDSSPTLPLVFTIVDENITLERRSAKSVTPFSGTNEIKYDYSPKANIPPGVFALHYHRLDNGRHRLGLSDSPCFLQDENRSHNISDCCTNLSTPWNCCKGNNCYSSNCDEVIKFKEGDIEHVRCFIQFHVAYNNLEEYRSDTNEGCIVLDSNNFATLFPFSFLELPTSPLIRHSNHGAQTEQQGRVLVFITDLTYNKESSQCEKQNNQISYFNSLLSGELNDSHFRDTPERQDLKNNWLLALPPDQTLQSIAPSPPKNLRVLANETDNNGIE